MRIRIKNCQRKITINKDKLAGLARRVLEIKKEKGVELNILFVGKLRMRRLNRKYRNTDRATDVLAFSMRESAPAAAGQRQDLLKKLNRGLQRRILPKILGEIVICPEIARQYAQAYNSSTQTELCLYLVHGILHLLGYTDTDKNGYHLMNRQQNRIFKQVLKKN